MEQPVSAAFRASCVFFTRRSNCLISSDGFCAQGLAAADAVVQGRTGSVICDAFVVWSAQ
jgi:hypothetical protein